MSQIVDDGASGSDESTALARRIKRERASHGWSLAALAEASGVSRAMISRIERGTSSPTATILGRLSGALGLTMSELLADEPTHEPMAAAPALVRSADADRWTDPETGYDRRPVSGPTFPVDVTEVRLPPGRSVTYPASTYAFTRHLIWVLDGTLELVHGGTADRLGSGDRIELGEPAETTYRNPTSDGCRYVVVVTRG